MFAFVEPEIGKMHLITPAFFKSTLLLLLVRLTVVCIVNMELENNLATEPLLYFSIIHVQPNRHTIPSDAAGHAF